MQITRKEFLGRLLGSAAGLVGAAVVVGCSSSSDSGGGGGGTPDAGSTPSDAAHATSCTMNGTVSTIGANHGHVLLVSKQDVTAGVDKTYDITGTANHPHSVTVTAAMFGMLKNDTTVMTTSTTDASHNHPITVMCG
ncbi:MAG TPA: hypothetical protein VHW23_08510 [Kofleriaceae bacterium]|jgi:hypothetical protein|nr:hypothetical protein [Kofleriaceae bacterium]